MSTFANGVNCDIYIGQGAGKKLKQDIDSASVSVKIISPYLSDTLVNELIEMKRKHLDVELITENKIGTNDIKILKKLIIQQRETNTIAVGKRDKWARLASLWFYASLGLTALFLWLVFLVKDPGVYLGIVPVIGAFLVYYQYRTRVGSAVIYQYSYSTLFPIKVITYDKNRGKYRARDKNEMSLHSKIYLIDNRIAYLGSLNYTISGLEKNYETRVRTEDPTAVGKLSAEFTHLMNSSIAPEKDIQLWGKEIYEEPVN